MSWFDDAVNMVDDTMSVMTPPPKTAKKSDVAKIGAGTPSKVTTVKKGATPLATAPATAAATASKKMWTAIGIGVAVAFVLGLIIWAVTKK